MLLHHLPHIRQLPGQRLRALLGFLLIAAGSACSTQPVTPSVPTDINPADLMTVDCLLPPQIRQLGTHITYLAARRPIRTSGARCALRGGEFVAHDRADFRTALAVWLPQAEQGDPEAQTYVGEIYEKGMGTPASYELAASWYQRAADQNYSRAQINLGYLYESGLGVPRDLARALNLYRQASGFTAAEIEYVSSIEVANREAARQQTQELQEEVQFLQARINDYQRNLKAQTNALEGKQRKIDELNSSLVTKPPAPDAGIPSIPEITAKFQRETEALQAQQHRQFEQERAVNRTELERLRRELDISKADHARQTAQLETLQLSLSSKQAGLSATAAEQIVQTRKTGPSINIIDPPVLLTRGSPALRFGSNAPIRVIGHINPANDLFAFRVNGNDHPIDESGLFQFNTANDEGARTLELLAVDRQGASTRLAIELPDTQPPVVQTQTNGNTDQAAAEQPAPGTTKQISTALPVDDIDFGEYHALIIGNDTYESMSDLRTAGNDAIAVERILREKYDFRTVLLLNANQKTLLNALERMRATLGSQDNLVIYYAGHGELDRKSGRGYWLPTDASSTNKAKWLANSAVTAMIDTMEAKHVLVIADSCYSGTLTRSSVARPLPQVSPELKRKWLKAVSRSRVRTVLSSGGVRPVLDGSPGSRHSVFATHFLEALENNETVLETYALFFDLQTKVSETATSLDALQIPQYAPIRHSGHQAGEFVFVPATIVGNPG